MLLHLISGYRLCVQATEVGTHLNYDFPKACVYIYIYIGELNTWKINQMSLVLDSGNPLYFNNSS